MKPDLIYLLETGRNRDPQNTGREVETEPVAGYHYRIYDGEGREVMERHRSSLSTCRLWWCRMVPAGIAFFLFPSFR